MLLQQTQTLSKPCRSVADKCAAAFTVKWEEPDKNAFGSMPLVFVLKWLP